MLAGTSYITALLTAYAAYSLGALSPGPSNMAIMSTAMKHGRAAAVTVAAGVITMSWTWAAVASTGLSSVLLAWPEALLTIRLFGGSYLIYLGIRAAQSAMRERSGDSHAVSALSRNELMALYRQGLMIHAGNPKAIMAWIATISIGLQPGVPSYMPFVIMLGCAILAVVIYGVYAFVFSVPNIARIYLAAHRWIDGALAAFFVIAGASMILSLIGSASALPETSDGLQFSGWSSWWEPRHDTLFA